ncbi:hypothetical protein EXIGLDRAFT_639482 [Exidia glandulosa HHB12029]|uniref:Sacsin/Nov domain-containing protein n=1 Tax=Exidia glandulosa HHB12029 TaxID=1314781 RepID=A0A165N931_EXIGL|nr:hypothetical protein EXIGLDRAFT_639482 [Exidia glandulosa HHB12029]
MASNKELLWAQGHDETVEVNQRALIDKVLARYSGEFTVFRELLQNSDDAGATAAEIHFRTRDRKTGAGGQLPDLKTAPVHEYAFRNNGTVFRDEDWKRLKKIADGNPDEEKIGAFGVGFYSIFSVCEAPMVTSGPQWMGFYWKDGGDQLFVRRGQVPAEQQADDWTTFDMPLREPGPIPNAFDLTRFLTSSITFMTHLNEVSIFFDDIRLSHISKAAGTEKTLGVPKALRPRSVGGTMTVRGVTSRALHIKAEVLRWVYSSGSEKAKPEPKAQQPAQMSFFSSLFSGLSAPMFTPPRTPEPPLPPAQVQEDLLKEIESSVMLAIYSAHAGVKLDNKLAQELQRSTKKNAPSQVRVDLIYTGKDEYDASVAEEEKHKLSAGIFRGLRADLEGSRNTRIFIGHATGQTTGLGGHVSARFIPTVERESIDLQDRNVAIWNRELLYVGGFLARAAYELEMDQLKELWEGASVQGESASESKTWLQQRATHALRFFTFHPSHPSVVVSELLEAGFFSCSEQQRFPILSTKGILDGTKVRMPNADFAFIETLPVVHADIIEGAKQMVSSLRRRGFLADIQFKDVLEELRARPLTEAQMVECLKWRTRLNTDVVRGHDMQLRREFLDACIFIPAEDPNKLIALSNIKTFISVQHANRILVDGPLPPHTLPFSVSRQVLTERLPDILGWSELSVVEWLEHLVRPVNGPPLSAEFDITCNPMWAERVLTCLARALPSMSKTDQNQVAEKLHSVKCIPTKTGMMEPEKSYFASVNMFEDLAVVAFPKTPTVRGNLEKLLLLLGVRRHVDLQLVFTRMISTGGWSTYDLVKYLVSVQSSLSPEEVGRLSATHAFPREGAEAAPGERGQRFAPGDLYEPLDTFRTMGLPVLKWHDTHKWRSNGEEAQFMFKIGLRKFPPLEMLLQLASGKDEKRAATALRYLLDNIDGHYANFDPKRFPDAKFVPAVKPDGTKTMASPLEVYANADSSAMGFVVVDASLRSEAAKLRIAESPSPANLIDVLVKTPPQSKEVATRWFEFMAGRLGDFSPQQFTALQSVKFVPSPSKAASGAQTLLSPKEVYFGSAVKREHLSQLFVFVDFGARANTFLRSCGVTDEPTIDEIVRMLIADPKRFYKLAGGYEWFLDELRYIAANERNITAATRRALQRSPALLGTKRVPKVATSTKSTSRGTEDNEDEVDYELLHDLLPANEICITDDQLSSAVFSASFFSAPQEDLLERFYASLGSPLLSNLVKEEYKEMGAELKTDRAALQTETMRKLILERLPLFLHDMRSTNRTLVLTLEWLNKPDNLQVRIYPRIVRLMTFQKGTVRKSENHEVSASAKHISSSALRTGPLVLSLSEATPLDMYEAAGSLCRLILKSPRTQDSLLLLTLLTTDLRSLRRRGYNVDRILRSQAAERRAIEAKMAPQGTQDTHLASDDKSIDEHSALINRSPVQGSDLQQGPSGRFSKLLRGFRKDDRTDPQPRDLRPEPTTAPPNGGPPPPPSASTRPNPPQGLLPPPPPLPPSVQNVLSKPQAHVTPRSDIDRNVRQAIAGCRPETASSLRDRTQMSIVKEAQDEGYCDISGRVEDLELVGNVRGTKVFISPHLPQRQATFSAKGPVIERFLTLIGPLREIYKLPAASIHIFLDGEGPTVAFNRGGSLFLNLRFYEAWHDQDVINGNLSNGYSSWFFTLAHEIAHNLVHIHNAEHEFYFSTISQAHVGPLASLLLQGGGRL